MEAENQSEANLLHAQLCVSEDLDHRGRGQDDSGRHQKEAGGRKQLREGVQGIDPHSRPPLGPLV